MSVKNRNSIVTDGLVFYVDAGNANSYPGSGATWTDLAGGNDGTFSATPTTDSANAGSIVFDGVDDLCTFPSDASPVTDAISVCLWYNGHPTVNSSSTTMRSEFGTIDAQRIFSIHIPWSNGKIYWDCGTNGGSANNSYDRTSKDSSNVHRGWNYWVFWKDTTAASNRMKIYLNGSLWHQASGGTKTMPSATAVTIGGRSQGSEYDNGTFSNVCIYNRALSAAEILQNYNALKNRFI